MSTDTIAALTKQDAELAEERMALVRQKVQNESDLAQITALFRSGHRFPRDAYAETLGRQARLIADNAKLLSRITEIKPERHRINQILNELRQDAKVEPQIPSEDGPLRSEILALRKRYSEFAADGTRVSSMRRMASEFVCDLDALLKRVKSDVSRGTP